MVRYLRAVPARPDGPSASETRSPLPAAEALGPRLFAQACAGCHLPGGDGRQSPWAALRGSHTATDPAGTNLLQVLTQGTQIQTSQGLMFMHPFTSAYSDDELAALANCTSSQFGSRRSAVTPEQIRKRREPAPSKPAF